VQVNPVKPPLKPPGINRLKLSYDKLLSNFALKFNLRRNIKADEKGTEQQALEINYDPEGLFKEVDETSVGPPQPRSVPVHIISSCGLPGAGEVQ
jgi:hypothetical protein